jgi:Zn-dependent protease with chaperone function
VNFFEAQDRSRRTTRRLVLLFLLATVVIVAAVTLIVSAAIALSQPLGTAGIFTADWLQSNAGVLGGVALATAGTISVGSIYRTAKLSAGGGQVARELGGTAVPTDVEDPLRRRLRNVVEEMAIASGVPVPDIYVLEEEPGINAFAAGFNTGDAAVAVTRGTLETLDRDELQGVIAHEFSHILNGDMRLNIRLMGLLFGILAIGLAGRMILHGTRHVRVSGRSDRGGAGAVVLIGLGLFLIGSLGVFMARLIKAGVSRQREYLADASAVQFTRQTSGIAGALKKIAAAANGSRLREADAEEVSHMLFSLGGRSFSSLMATHPPLEKRIRALDPTFDPDSLQRPGAAPTDAGADARAAGFAGGPAAGTRADLDADRITSSVGNPGAEHVAFAGKLRRALPEEIHHAAHSRTEVVLLVVALILRPEPAPRERQLALLESRLGAVRTRRVKTLFEDCAALGPLYRLPLLELAFPALKDRPTGQLAFLVELVAELSTLDGELDFYEYCYTRTLSGYLSEALSPRLEARHHDRDLKNRRTRKAVHVLLATLAQHGSTDEAGSRAAYQAGIATLDGEWPPWTAISDWQEQLDACLDILRHLSGEARRRVVVALVATIREDRMTTLAEAELLRAICAMLDCPLPPLASEEIAG